MDPTFIPLADVEGLRAAGIAYPSNIHGWRWMFRHRVDRNLDRAFFKIGNRIMVHVERYKTLAPEAYRPSR